MTALKTSWMIRLVCCCALAWPMANGQAPAPTTAVKRLYVEPFTTKAGSDRLRDDVIAELHKLSSVSVVMNDAEANLILGGGGEIWVRGYQSLNPRSGRSPANGKPIYGGYLSIELRDTQGETLWSYLVTPAETSTDISKSLARQIAKRVAAELQKDDPPSRVIPPPQPAATLHGAGATFPYPVYTKWLTNYRRENPNLEITYDAVGSEAGVRRLLAGEVDFGASDDPEAISRIAPKEEIRYLLYPSVVGAVVPITNLPGMTGDIAFTPEVLAGIYLGKIKKWNDPALQKANPRLRLPDLDIVVVHRRDGSGTTYAWTDFLSQTNPEWRKQVGAELSPAWPTGRAADGNVGVAQLVKEIGGSIGYVEFIYALQNHLNFGKVRNANGEFVAASLESIGVATRQAMEISDDLKVSLANAPGAGAYPIASFTWLIVPAHIADAGKRNAVTSFIKWMLGPGQAQAAALGYLGLPKEVILRELIQADEMR